MKLEDIDKIFNNNQHQFDRMPSDRLWERLEEKLDATPPMWEEKPTTKVRWLRYVAAAAVVLIMMVPALYLIDGTGVAPQAYKDNTATESQIAAKLEDTSSKSIEEIEENTPSNPSSINTTAKSIQENKKDAILKQYALEDRAENTFKDTDAPSNSTQPKIKTNERLTPTPKPTTKIQPLPPPPPPSSNSSYSRDMLVEDASEEDFSFADREIEEETELEEEVLPTPSISRKAMPTSKKEAGGFQPGSPNINTTNKVHLDSRYNADFERNQFSNALPTKGAYTFESQQERSVKKPTKNRAKESKKRSSKKYASNKADASPTLTASRFLNTLEGNWMQYIGEKSYYETWINSTDGTLVGTASTLQDGNILFQEDISINLLPNGDLRYTLQHPQTLTLKASINNDDENLLIFENLQNDFPRKITYRLATDTMLEITFEGKKENETIVKQLIMVKQ